MTKSILLMLTRKNDVEKLDKSLSTCTIEGGEKSIRLSTEWVCGCRIELPTNKGLLDIRIVSPFISIDSVCDVIKRHLQSQQRAKE